MSKKILITGAGGLLGSDIYVALNSIFNVLPTSRSKMKSFNNLAILDVTDLNSVKKNIDEYKPDIIINCAAYTDVNNAEVNKKMCRNINVVGLENIVKVKSKNTKIIQKDKKVS